MAGRPKGSVPSLSHHKPSGRARVRLNGRDHWLGKWGSAEASLAYDRLITELLASRRLSPASAQPAEPVSQVVIEPASPGITVASAGTPVDACGHLPTEPTVAEVVMLYLEHCDTYYRTPAGERTSTYGNALQAARALRPFDDTLASKFGPRKLGMIRDSRMVTVGSWSAGPGRREISSQNCRSGRPNTCSVSGFASGPPSF
jgi:hypothetical protein